MTDHFTQLLQTITTLRAPGGCPWDQKQTLTDAARYLLDEAAEVLEAALAGDLEHVREELADLLFMNCFCCEILSEELDVTMFDIAAEGTAKLIRRHPHVFGDAEARDTEESQQRWQAMKDQEKRAKGIDPTTESILKEMPASTAPLHQAYCFQDNAADNGFDWPEISGVWAKLHEELDELHEAIAKGNPAEMEHELGDLLFSVVNLGRWLKVQPDLALRRANRRFQERFHLVESQFLESGRELAGADIDELEAAWQGAKAELARRQSNSGGSA